MKVQNEITVYEIDGTETRNSNIAIESHWNWHDRVVLIVGGKEYTVEAEDLTRAIANATNHR